MSRADVVILVFVGLSTLIGLLRGLVREVISVIVWLIAFVTSLALADRVARLFGLDGTLGMAVGFGVVFVAILVGGAFAQRMMAKLVRSTGMGGTDRLLGALFGALRGGLVVVVALIALRPFAAGSGWWRASVLAPELLAFERGVLDLLDAAGQLARSLG